LVVLTSREEDELSEPIEFFFDFSSPYGYLASHRINDIAAKHGRLVIWRPFLLGAVFQVNGQSALMSQQFKADYSLLDMTRSARRFDIPLQMLDPFPVATQAAGRIYYWIEDQDKALARQFAKAVYGAYFGDNINIMPKETVAEIAEKIGFDYEDCICAINDETYKQRLKDVTIEAMNRNVCGSPFMFVDGEPFWGNDRLEMVDQWLESGGW
jgi:2-hydroxychromene-2-carboxylate isomerase